MTEDDETFARESFNEMVQGELASIDAVLEGTIEDPHLRQQIIDHKNLLLSGISHLREALEGDLTSEQITGIYSAVVVVTGSIRLLSDQTFIYSGAAERFSEKVKAFKARAAKLDKAQTRLGLLRSALREQAETVPLVDSVKYADSIRDDLMKRLALNSADSRPSISGKVSQEDRIVLSGMNLIDAVQENGGGNLPQRLLNYLVAEAHPPAGKEEEVRKEIQPWVDRVVTAERILWISETRAMQQGMHDGNRGVLFFTTREWEVKIDENIGEARRTATSVIQGENSRVIPPTHSPNAAGATP